MVTDSSITFSWQWGLVFSVVFKIKLWCTNGPYTKLLCKFRYCKCQTQTMVGKVYFPYAFSSNEGHINTYLLLVLRHFQWGTPRKLIQPLNLKHKARNNSPIRAQLNENRAKKQRSPASTIDLQMARRGLRRAVRVARRGRLHRRHRPRKVGDQQSLKQVASKGATR